MQFSIVNYSDIEKLSDFRIDSHYWHPDLMRNGALVSPNSTVALFVKSNIENIKTSPIDRNFEYLEISNISITYGGDYKTVEIIEGEEPDRAHHILQKNDVVVSTVRPNRNAVALIQKNGIIGSSGLCVLRADNINPKYLYIFCKTDYFVKCLIRADKASMYPAVSNSDILKTAIFVPSDNFQKSIVEQITEAFQKKALGKETYQQAQDLLLAELGLGDWQPKHELTYSKNYSDTVQAGRIDAEYYQPKYDKIIKAITEYSITKYSTPPPTLGDLATIKKSIEVGSSEYLNEGIPFIRVSNINPFEITEEKYISEELYNQIITHQPKKGEILLSKDATPGIAFHLDKTPKKMIPSGGILRLKLKTDNINGEYLTLVLNSLLTKEQANRDVGGSVIMHWRPEQVSRVVIPILPKDKQLEIQEKVMKSFELRERSKTLLENAKRAVEIAIEQDETTAIQFLNSAT